MRTALLAVVAGAALTIAVRAATPQKIVFTRVFPNDGQIGLFVAARDGSGERPLLSTRDMDYDPVWSPRRPDDRVHLRSRRLGRSVSREA